MLRSLGTFLTNTGGYFSSREIEKHNFGELDIFFENQCAKTTSQQCLAHKRTLVTQGDELREFVLRKNFGECSIVKMAEKIVKLNMNIKE